LSPSIERAQQPVQGAGLLAEDGVEQLAVAGKTHPQADLADDQHVEVVGDIAGAEAAPRRRLAGSGNGGRGHHENLSNWKLSRGPGRRTAG
jgi:hypothetical protein